MVNKYKTIVLLKGFEPMSDHHFSLFKSLLAKDLSLERAKQEHYTKVQIADIMEEKFPDDAGLDKLIKFCEYIPALRKRAEFLKKEQSEVTGETPLETNEPDAGRATPTSTTCNTVASERGETSTAQKRKNMNKEKTETKKSKASERPDQPPCPEEETARCQSQIPQMSSLSKNQETHLQNPNIPKDSSLQTETLTVMVLKATDTLEYESRQHKVKKMFHATVATVNQYFHVKVFNIDLKVKFTKNNFIILSNYSKNKGILEINEASSVLEAAPNQKIEVPNHIVRKANESPKIHDIKKGATGALFYGLFMLYKIKVNPKSTIYEIKDCTGNMEVVGKGKWHNMNCKEGDKLQLFGCYLKTIDKDQKLVCGEDSYIKVTKVGREKKESTAN